MIGAVELGACGTSEASTTQTITRGRCPRGWKNCMSKTKGNAIIGQSGGPTSVINQSLVGAIREARNAPHIDRLFGARHGVRGIVNDDLLDLKRVPDDLLGRIAQSPASALGSTRDKPDRGYCERIFHAFE